MASTLKLFNNRIPTLELSGNVLGELDDGRLILMENQINLNINKVRDLRNKIFIGFDNIIGLTQQNIFHNVQLNSNKLYFKQFEEANEFDFRNKHNYLIDSTISKTSFGYNQIFEYTPAIGNTTFINLNNFFQPELYRDIFNKNNIDPENIDTNDLVYTITAITITTPVKALTTSNHTIVPNTKLDDSFIKLDNLQSISNSIKIIFTYKIEYNTNRKICKNRKYSIFYLLLQENIQLMYDVTLNNVLPTQIPKNLIVDDCCPKVYHDPKLDNYTIGQKASTKIKHCILINNRVFTKTVKLKELVYRNICGKEFIDTTKDIEFTPNGSGESVATLKPFDFQSSLHCKQIPRNTNYLVSRGRCSR